MTNFLFKTFIKNHEDIKNPKVRDDYGKFAGIVGIISNAILCVMKILIGLVSGSIAIVADGINNLAFEWRFVDEKYSNRHHRNACKLFHLL